VIFDGKSEDFATEMFVIINSTPTRINRSHLVDLYERVTWAKPDSKLAAKVADMLYSESDSPLRYRINRLGGRSRKEKWILQSELFNELHRWVRAAYADEDAIRADRRAAVRLYEMARDFLRAARRVWGEAWGDARYMITKPVTLKAMLRVAADLAAEDAEPAVGREARWQRRLEPWGERVRDFRADGFYERFAAKGQVERVGRIHRELARAAGIGR
jgi:DGQHR domain-containing protein